jgi:hypothetical protein
LLWHRAFSVKEEVAAWLGEEEEDDTDLELEPG